MSEKLINLQPLIAMNQRKTSTHVEIAGSCCVHLCGETAHVVGDINVDGARPALGDAGVLIQTIDDEGAILLDTLELHLQTHHRVLIMEGVGYADFLFLFFF